FLFTALLFVTSCKKGSDDTPEPTVLPSLSIVDAMQAEGKNNTAVLVTVKLDGTNTTNVVVKYATIEGTATSNIDFRGETDGTLTFSPSETEKTISITILGDENEEADETFEVLLLNPLNATLARDKATVTIQNDDTIDTTPTEIPTIGYTTPMSYAGKTLVWNDEFEGNSLSSDWTHEIGTGNSGWGNNELQYYRAENTRIQDGYMIIEAKKEPFGGRAYTSSRLVTQGKKSFKYGRIDIRAALPKGQGLWPALWMLGDNFNTTGWPSCGEIDIMEMVGGNTVNDATTHGTVHWEENGHANFGGSKRLSSGILADEFHVFSINWTAQKIQWLLDDVVFHEINITPSDLSEFHESFFFIFNVAVGGNWPGSPDNTTIFPQRMAVDYVRVFQ
ncbi:MAG: family 16 glycosylhydrolase, partial [Chitinophagales bacterium]